MDEHITVRVIVDGHDETELEISMDAVIHEAVREAAGISTQYRVTPSRRTIQRMFDGEGRKIHALQVYFGEEPVDEGATFWDFEMDDGARLNVSTVRFGEADAAREAEIHRRHKIRQKAIRKGRLRVLEPRKGIELVDNDSVVFNW